jgi:hypothetical protein
MKRLYFSLILIPLLVLSSCGIKTAQEVVLQFSTEKFALPDSLIWRNIGFAKELTDQKERQGSISQCSLLSHPFIRHGGPSETK